VGQKPSPFNQTGNSSFGAANTSSSTGFGSGPSFGSTAAGGGFGSGPSFGSGFASKPVLVQRLLHQRNRVVVDFQRKQTNFKQNKLPCFSVSQIKPVPLVN
jgi:hypothetical protein